MEDMDIVFIPDNSIFEIVSSYYDFHTEPRIYDKFLWKLSLCKIHNKVWLGAIPKELDAYLNENYTGDKFSLQFLKDGLRIDAETYDASVNGKEKLSHENAVLKLASRNAVEKEVIFVTENPDMKKRIKDEKYTFHVMDTENANIVLDKIMQVLGKPC